MKYRTLLSLLKIVLREGSSVSARSKAFFIELYRSSSSTFGFAAFKIGNCFRQFVREQAAPI